MIQVPRLMLKLVRGPKLIIMTHHDISAWADACFALAEIMSDYEAKLTAGYSQTYSKGTNAGVTVSVEDGQHGTVTAGDSSRPDLCRLILLNDSSPSDLDAKCSMHCR